MSWIRGIVRVLILNLIQKQRVWGGIIRFKDGKHVYEYDNNSVPLGVGKYGTVYKGIRKEGAMFEFVAIKEMHEEHLLNYLEPESKMYARIGRYDHIPEIYYYSPNISEKAILVTELLGKNMYNLLREFEHFSTATVMRVGLQMLDTLEHINKKGFIHYDAHIANTAVGHKNNSKIYLFDFGETKLITDIDCDFEGREDLKRLSDTLNYMAYGLDKFDQLIKDREVDCKEALDEFKDKALYPATKKPDYGELRKILNLELKKHRNDPNYNQFECQNKSTN